MNHKLATKYNLRIKFRNEYQILCKQEDDNDGKDNLTDWIGNCN